MESIPKAVCTMCAVEKDFTAEFFITSKRTKTGLVRRCCDCTRAAGRAKYAANAAQINAAAKEKRLANPEYYSMMDKRSRDKRREEIRQRYTADRAANPERYKEYSARNYAKRREKQLIAMKVWRAENPDYEAKRRAEYPEKHKAKNHRRRALLKNAEGSFTPAEWRAKVKAYGGKCHWCGKPIDGNPIVEHVIPLARGGTNYISNVVPSCNPCNTAKGTKLPHEFAGRLF